jgi:hypothetical protein
MHRLSAHIIQGFRERIANAFLPLPMLFSPFKNEPSRKCRRGAKVKE